MAQPDADIKLQLELGRGESEHSLKFPLSKDVMQKYMYGNAARLLNI